MSTAVTFQFCLWWRRIYISYSALQ